MPAIMVDTVATVIVATLHMAPAALAITIMVTWLKKVPTVKTALMMTMTSIINIMMKMVLEYTLPRSHLCVMKEKILTSKRIFSIMRFSG